MDRIVSIHLRRISSLLASAIGGADDPRSVRITEADREELATVLPEFQTMIRLLPVVTSSPTLATPKLVGAAPPDPAGRPPKFPGAGQPSAPTRPPVPAPEVPSEPTSAAPAATPADVPAGPAPAPPQSPAGARVTIVTTGTPPAALARRVFAIVFSHEEDGPSPMFAVPRTADAVRALIPAWKAHADAMHGLGIPVTRCIPPGLAQLYASVPEMRDYYAYAAARGFQFAGRNHEGSVLGNAADAAYWLAKGGAPPCDVLGTWTRGTVPQNPLPALHAGGSLSWVAAIGGSAVPGHGADDHLDGVEVFAPGRIGIYTGTANNTASLRGAAADAAGRPIRYTMGGSPLYVDTTIYNVLPRIDGRAGALCSPVRHDGAVAGSGHVEQAGVPIVDDLTRALADCGDTRSAVTFFTPQALAELWTGGSFTYEVPQR